MCQAVLVCLMTTFHAVVSRVALLHAPTLISSCKVIRSQVKSIYRFGHRANCDRKFEEFKFCLSLKVMHLEEQRDAWIRRRAEWWAHRRLGKSSEDVWDIRE